MHLRPMLATPADTLPIGPQWSYEVKWDGYRCLAVRDARGARLISRHAKDLTRDYPGVAAAVAALRTPMILDGEIVAVDGHGRSSFRALQHRTAAARETIAFYAFDLLAFGDEDWTSKPLEGRRKRLASALKGSTLLLSSPL